MPKTDQDRISMARLEGYENGRFTVNVIILDTLYTDKKDSHEPTETQHVGGNIHHEQTSLSHVKKQVMTPI